MFHPIWLNAQTGARQLLDTANADLVADRDWPLGVKEAIRGSPPRDWPDDTALAKCDGVRPIGQSNPRWLFVSSDGMTGRIAEMWLGS